MGDFHFSNNFSEQVRAYFSLERLLGFYYNFDNYCHYLVK